MPATLTVTGVNRPGVFHFFTGNDCVNKMAEHALINDIGACFTTAAGGGLIFCFKCL
jgi:hypothetical protein